MGDQRRVSTSKIGPPRPAQYPVNIDQLLTNFAQIRPVYCNLRHPSNATRRKRSEPARPRLHRASVRGCGDDGASTLPWQRDRRRPPRTPRDPPRGRPKQARGRQPPRPRPPVAHATSWQVYHHREQCSVHGEAFGLRNALACRRSEARPFTVVSGRRVSRCTNEVPPCILEPPRADLVSSANPSL